MIDAARELGLKRNNISVIKYYSKDIIPYIFEDGLFDVNWYKTDLYLRELLRGTSHMIYYELKDYYKREAVIAKKVVDEYNIGTERSWQVFLNRIMWEQKKHRIISRPPYKYLALCKFYIEHQEEINNENSQSK
jgi:hypothetical protein